MIFNTKNIFLAVLLFVSFISCGVEEAACPIAGCLNSGACVNGACACPDGYEGEDCAIEKTPISMSIVGINVSKYPTLKPDSSSWDPQDNSGPDLFFAFHEGTSSAYNLATDIVSTTKNNATGLSFDVDVAPPYLVTALAANWSLDLWDADGTGAAEYMDGIILVPLSKTSGLPTSFEVSTPTVTATFFVQWDF